ncbi:MAG: 7-carboxy-7-deazaguanine synthase QueE [Planctomycetes bacterium]|nr:7-carboxy-7-deazaguanine synthase QueE [Planctomycetota bacterium]
MPKPHDASLLVTEIYASLQGESTFAGVPFVLVRLARCHLRCTWCDSAFTFKGGERWSVASVLAEVRSHMLPHVLVTGGEPLLQPAVHKLMTTLCDEEYTVLLETSGALDVSQVDPRVRRIVDLKCPGSGESARNLWSNVRHLSVTDELKFVIADRADYEWARDVIRREKLGERVGAILLSPVAGDASLPRDIAKWLIQDRLPARLQLQLHKILWDPKDRKR